MYSSALMVSTPNTLLHVLKSALPFQRVHWWNFLVLSLANKAKWYPSYTAKTESATPRNHLIKCKHSARIYLWSGKLKEKSEFSSSKLSPLCCGLWQDAWHQRDRRKSMHHSTIIIKHAWIVKWLKWCLHPIIFYWFGVKGILCRQREKSKPDSQSESESVCWFKSGHTLQQLALLELLCNYQLQQQGKWKTSQTSCHPMGKHLSQFQCLKFTTECGWS